MVKPGLSSIICKIFAKKCSYGNDGERKVCIRSQRKQRKKILPAVLCIAGVICFTVLYFLLPSSIYTYIGILGGIGVGLSAKYGWQAVFNTFGALAIATERYGLKGAVGLRVIQNVFGVVFALIFCSMFYWLMSKKKETVVTVAAK